MGRHEKRLDKLLRLMKMMKGMQRTLAAFTMAVLCVMVLATCSSDDTVDPEEVDPDETNDYLLGITPPGGTGELAQIATDLTSGQLDIANAKASMTYPLRNINGVIYSRYADSNGYVMYSISDQGDAMRKEGITASQGDNFDAEVLDIGNGQLIGVYTNEYFSVPKIYYDLIDVATFKVTKSGELPVKLLPGSLIWPTGVAVKEGQIYFFYRQVDEETLSSYDTAYALVVNKATLAVERTTKDSRTASAGYERLTSSFLHTDGGLYISTSNTDYVGMNETKPAGVLRISSGNSVFDDSYFFDVSTSVGGNHNLGLLPIGSGKAITKVFRKDLITQQSDFSNAYCIEYWVLDVVNRLASKLDIPLSKGAIEVDPVSLGNNKYAIVANTAGGNFFYIYDASTGNVSEGLQYTGGVISDVIPFPKP